MKTPILVSLLAFICATARGQDPATTSPKYYKLLLENDQVRVLEYRLKPGEKEPMHSHPAGIVYVLSGATVKFTYPNGKTEEKPAASGETIWREPTTHAVENVGTTEAHAIAVDLKSARAAQTSKDEETLWNLERAYWRYVQDNDLSSYANLWHERFLGWPSVSNAPVHPRTTLRTGSPRRLIRDWYSRPTN